MLHRTRPDVLALEKMVYKHNQATDMGVAEAHRVILLAAAHARTPVVA